MTDKSLLPVRVKCISNDRFDQIYVKADMSSLPWWDIRKYMNTWWNVWNTYDFFEDSPLSNAMSYSEARHLISRCKTWGELKKQVSNIKK